MPKATSSYRIPRYLHEFISAYKRDKHVETSTEVLIFALDTLKNIWEDEKKGNNEMTLKFVTHSVNSDILTPKERVLHKVEHDSEFRKKEYEVVQLLTDEQQKDYIENYQDLGMTIQEYYEGYIKGKK